MNIYKNIKESYADAHRDLAIEPGSDEEAILNDMFDEVPSKYVEISSKSVEDSDGFMTDYTLYHDTEENVWVTVFGDKEIYKPEQGEFDFESAFEDEAKEWFASYEGFKEGEDFKETPKSIASLKSLLEQLADKDFYHNMKDNWTREDFEIDDRNNKEIQKVIDQLKEQGVETKYRMGYPIEYSDDALREAEEDKLSNEEWYELHKDEIQALNDDPNIDFTGTKDDFCLIIRGNATDEEQKEESEDFVIDKDIPADELPTDKDLANKGICPYCSGPITEEEYKLFGMCGNCYDNNVE